MALYCFLKNLNLSLLFALYITCSCIGNTEFFQFLVCQYFVFFYYGPNVTNYFLQRDGRGDFCF